jgi:long-subunit acyl-CoA synthetase (AMP-forming)
MGLFSENRPEYVLIETACMSDSITIVPIPTRAAEYASVQQLLDLTELRTLVVSKHTLPLIADMYEDGYINHIRTVICLDSDLDQELEDQVKAMKYITFITYNEVLRKGRAILDEVH